MPRDSDYHVWIVDLTLNESWNCGNMPRMVGQRVARVTPAFQRQTGRRLNWVHYEYGELVEES